MINNENQNISYFLIPRSSISKTPFRMSNSIGLIDAGYRGELMAYVDSLDLSAPKVGDRLFQLVTANLVPIQELKIIDELSNTTRSEGGFGSTGK